MTPVHASAEFAPPLTSALIAVWLIQKLKAVPWVKWVGVDRARGNRIAALLTSLVSAATMAGIGHSWNTVTHTLTISNLTLGSLAYAAWLWLKQFALQEAAYQATANRAPKGTTP